MSPVKITSIMSAACIAMTVVFSFLFHALCPVENLSGGVVPLMVAEAVFALVPAMITESLPAGRKREASFLFLAVSLVLFASSVIIISVSATAAAFREAPAGQGVISPLPRGSCHRGIPLHRVRKVVAEPHGCAPAFFVVTTAPDHNGMQKNGVLQTSNVLQHSVSVFLRSNLRVGSS